MFQVDVIEFTTAIKNEFSFKVGCKEGFGPWMDKVLLIMKWHMKCQLYC